ncbi:MAG: DNA-3-methyladenine glycosylase [Candidatus Dormibacteria bacterium]
MAQELLGKVLAVRQGRGWVGGTIIETEAYLAVEDDASHSRRGPTPRSAIMFGPPGVAYVYFIYGMYHCLNAVTEAEGQGAAVLVRALSADVPASGGVISVGVASDRLGGPGLLCRALGIDLRLNGHDLVSGDRVRVCAGHEVNPDDVRRGPRVGIRRARDLQLRFRLTPSKQEECPGPRS